MNGNNIIRMNGIGGSLWQFYTENEILVFGIGPSKKVLISLQNFLKTKGCLLEGRWKLSFWEPIQVTTLFST